MARILSLIVFITVVGSLITFPVGARVIRTGDQHSSGVALTFDLCPVRSRNGLDEALIAFLTKYQIHATFFVSGSWAAHHDAAFRSLLAVPYFEIGTHGETHISLPELSRQAQLQEITRPVVRVSSEGGHAPVLFRPPFGHFSKETEEIAESQGLKLVMWSVVSGDPDPNLPAEQMERFLNRQVHSGSIVVFHANGRGRHTCEVVEALYLHLLQRGLKPVTVSELLANPVRQGH